MRYIPVLLVAAAVSPAMALETVVVNSGLDDPIFLDSPGDGDDRRFVAERDGRVLVLDGAGVASTYLTIPGVATGGGEDGFLGFAFHPNFASPGTAGYGEMFLNYTVPGTGDSALHTVIERVTFSDPAAGESGGVVRQDVLRIDQPQSNHNAGWLGFSPTDGLLYIPTGDGGGNDPNDNAQALTSLLGKVLRIDINGDDFPSDPGRNYAIPGDNPFATTDGPELDEIWAWGLRNPFRDSFDRVTGEFYLADVGQNSREELNRAPAGEGGQNYGWDIREGSIDNPATGGTLPPDQRTDPIFDYPHSGEDSLGQTIIGGYVYRGDLLGEDYQGLYFFADFISGRVFTLDPDLPGQGAIDITADLFGSPLAFDIISFGEDAQGELYVLTDGVQWSEDDGAVYRIVPEPGTLAVLAGLGLTGVLRRGRRRSNFGGAPT